MSNPARRALIAGNDNAEWTFFGIKRLAVTGVCQNDFSSGESWVEFRQCENDFIACGSPNRFVLDEKDFFLLGGSSSV